MHRETRSPSEEQARVMGDEDESLLGWTGMDGGRRHKDGDARRHVTVRPVNVSCILHHKKDQLQWQWNLEGVSGH